MPNIEFVAPWTERQQSGCPCTIKQFSKASQANRLLYLDSYKSSIVAFLDTFCDLRFAAGPESRSDEEGKFINIQANASNTEFSPCLITPSLVKHTLGLARTRAVPEFSITHTPLDSTILEGLDHPFGSHNVNLFMFPMGIILEGKKAWIEGLRSRSRSKPNMARRLTSGLRQSHCKRKTLTYSRYIRR